jgi:hypothetical protein
VKGCQHLGHGALGQAGNALEQEPCVGEKVGPAGRVEKTEDPVFEQTQTTTGLGEALRIQVIRVDDARVAAKVEETPMSRPDHLHPHPGREAARVLRDPGAGQGPQRAVSEA